MSIRTERVANIIKEEMSLIFLQKVQDPEIGLVTITGVKVTPDLRQARIYFSVYDKNMRERTLKRINQIKGLIRHELGGKLTIKFTPELFFYIDDTIDYVEKMEGIFKKIHNDDNE